MFDAHIDTDIERLAADDRRMMRLMGQTLFDLLTRLNLEVYPSDELRQQALDRGR